MPRTRRIYGDGLVAGMMKASRSDTYHLLSHLNFVADISIPGRFELVRGARFVAFDVSVSALSVKR